MEMGVRGMLGLSDEYAPVSVLGMAMLGHERLGPGVTGAER